MKLIAFLVAVAAAFLVNKTYPPIVTMANQLVAILGWGLVLSLAPAPALQRPTLRAAAPLMIVFAMAAVGCAIGIVAGSQPSPPGIGVLGIIVLGALVALHGASAGASDLVGYFRLFAIALVALGVADAFVAIEQTFAPGAIDLDFIVLPTVRGRVGGNIGQPNQFADTMAWGLIALVSMSRRGPSRAVLERLARAGWCIAGLTMLLGIVLTGSRTGMVMLVLMAVWGLVDRKLDRPVRIALAISPLLAFAMQRAVAAWAQSIGLTLDMTDRHGVGVTAFRAEIWSNMLSLIKEQPWLGVGWGQLNFAWTLTPFASRGAGLVDNAHNLPLQLAVELGVPAAIVMTALLCWAFWRGARRAWRMSGDAGVAARSTMMIVVVVGLHSMLEYPLWYVYMLLPTAWAFGLLLGAESAAGPAAVVAAPIEDAPAATPAVAASPQRAWRVLGLLLVVVSASAWLDYLTIVDLFLPRPASLPLDERIQHGQASKLFANQADYVAFTTYPSNASMLPLIKRSSHFLLNGRLMYAWARQLNEQGEVDKARYLAARLREFDLSGPKPWFAPCDDPVVTRKPFQCLPPDHPVTWRDFR